VSSLDFKQRHKSKGIGIMSTRDLTIYGIPDCFPEYISSGMRDTCTKGQGEETLIEIKYSRLGKRTMTLETRYVLTWESEL
jgi:hypothetical protein